MLQRVFVWVVLFASALGELIGGPLPITTLETALLGRAENVLLKSIPAGALTATRDLTNSALSILAAGGSIAEAQQLLTLAFAVQNMNVTSPTFGSFPWYYNSNAVVDVNSDVFASQALGPIWLHYGHLFPVNFQIQMQQHLKATISALLRRNAAVTYTNIYLMNTVSLLLIGQSVGDASAVETATQMLNYWNSTTLAAGGVAEYGTSDYYSIDLNSLVMGFIYSSASLHGTFQSILNYFWTDIKANYFYGTQDLSGAHSRDYDFLCGSAGLLYYFWTEGKNSRFTTDLNLVEMGQVYVLENGLSTGGYHPNWSALPGVSDDTPKWITQTTSAATLNADRENYVTADFALSSANANYGEEDKLINLDLASNDPLLPNISIVPDVYDSPYGTVIAPDNGGHLKPAHQRLYPASVQKGGMLLTVLDLDPADAGSVSSFATNIIIPAKADSISINGEMVNLATPARITLSTRSWVGIREGQSAVLIRIFTVDSLGAVAPLLVLQSDATGLKSGAARITAYHYQGNTTHPITLVPTHLKIGVVIVAYHCANIAAWNSLLADALASRFTISSPNGMWRVQAQISGPEGGNLEISRNLVNRQTFTRTGGEK